MNPVVKTSHPDWLAEALHLFIEKKPFRFVDDAGKGFTEADLISAVQLIRAAREKAGVPWKSICTILAGMGISGTGMALIWLAVIDPEPTSKLAILLVGGVLLIFTGSLAILRALGFSFRVSARGEFGEFEVAPC
jgi:hypothetical protein